MDNPNNVEPEPDTFLDIKWNNKWYIGYYEGDGKWNALDGEGDTFDLITEEVQDWCYFNSQ